MLTKLIKEASEQFIQIDFTNGWKVENNKLQINYYEDEAYPVDVSQIADTDISGSGSDSDKENYISDEDEGSDFWSDTDEEETM